MSKNIATIEQIRTRNGRVLAGTNVDLPAGLAEDELRVPSVEPELDPIVLSIPLQSFALNAATTLVREVDRPRNLAKSVTVE